HRAGEEKLAALQQAREQLAETFAALSGQALRTNNEEFLRLARENLKQFQIQAASELEKKEKNIEGLVKPIRETLEKTERQIQLMEQERQKAYGSLSRYLETMAQTQQQLQSETRNLVKALRRPEVRGQWGEMTLKRLAELAGMVEYCDFYPQEHRATEDGALRPDMVVRLPNGREIVVDVKTPLDAYLSAVEAEDDAQRKLFLEHHARKVRERIRELAAKSYWSQFPKSPDFVVLFMPGEQFLSAALDQDPGLIEEALRQRVVVATPTSLVALLRAVAYGWRQETLAENAEQIRALGEQLYERLGRFSEHLAKLGRHLGSSVEQYNRTVGSFERQLTPSARRFTEMGIQERPGLDTPEPLEKTVRSLATGGDEPPSPGDS
ncbi:MAG: DNA recombination protein RmuC, partial [Gammaproteobacteria bacterium]